MVKYYYTNIENNNYKSWGIVMCKIVLYSKMDPEINPINMKQINDRLLSMINKDNPKVGYIASETDKERKYFNKTKRYYEQLGLKDILYFDLDEEYNSEIEEEFLSCDAIHLSSGNTYTFLSLLKKRNMISKLQTYSQQGGVLIGVSAGSLLVSKTIGSAKFGDDNEVGLKDLSALGLVDFEMMPHWNSWSFYLDGLKDYSKETKTTIYTVSDGEAIIIENKVISKYGQIDRIDNGVLYKE